MTTTDALETIWQIRKIVEEVPGSAMFADLPEIVQGVVDERDELAAINDKLSDLLRRTAIALKGPEPKLRMHDWSNLPERAADITVRHDRLRVLLRRALVVIERADVKTHLEVDIRKEIGET